MRRFMVRAAGAAVAVLVTAGVLTVPSASEAATPHRAVHARAAAVTLKAPARVDKGNRLVLTGTVRNRAVGTPVVVQRMLRYVGEWQNVGRTKVGKRGAVRFVDVPHRAGDRYYRLVVPTKHSRVQSRAVLVTVWEWIDLSDRYFVERVATFQHQIEYFGGDGDKREDVVLADSAVDQGHMTWDTQDGCTRVKGVIQSTDRSLGFAHGQFLVDGVVVAEKDLEGSTVHSLVFDVDVSAAKTFEFAWQKVDDDFSIGMHDASVYCPL